MSTQNFRSTKRATRSPTRQPDNAPTRLGNLIQSYETYPEFKYGLDSAFYWYRIWVSKDTKEEIDNAQPVVDSATYIVFALSMSGLAMWAYALMWLNWSALQQRTTQSPLPYLPSSPPILLILGPACLLFAFSLYRLSLHAHAQFGELFKSVFDQHRSKIEFGEVLREIERLRGAPYVGISNKQKYQIVWRFLRWQRIRDEAIPKNFKVKEWPRESRRASADAVGDAGGRVARCFSIIVVIVWPSSSATSGVGRRERWPRHRAWGNERRV